MECDNWSEEKKSILNKQKAPEPIISVTPETVIWVAPETVIWVALETVIWVALEPVIWVALEPVIWVLLILPTTLCYAILCYLRSSGNLRWYFILYF